MKKKLDVRIEEIRVRDIGQYALEQAKGDQMITISRTRGTAWANNPLADPDDVALLVAHVDDRAVGYFGLMTGMVRNPETGDRPMTFASTWFVDPNLKGGGVGGKLMRHSFGLGRDVVLTNLSDDAGTVSKALGLVHLDPLPYWHANLLDTKGLSLPFLAARKLGNRLDMREDERYRPVLLAGRHLSRDGLYAGLMLKLLPLLREIRTTEISAIDSTMEEAHDRWAPKRFLRTKEVVNWMLNDPWVMVRPRTAEDDRYYFDDHRRFFRRVALRIEGKDGRDKGFVIVRSHEDSWGTRHTAMFDHLLHDPADYRYAFAVAMREAAYARADEISLPDGCAKSIEGSPIYARIFARKKRTYVYKPAPDSPIDAVKDDIALFFADSDVAFC